jgi:glycosyltransferase involved in cell wall biosynthesis
MNYFKKNLIRITEFVIQRNFLLALYIYRLFVTNKKEYPNKIRNQISFLNTYDLGGGSAKIALSLAKLVRENLFSVQLFVKEHKTKENLVIEINRKEYTFLEEVLRREAQVKGWIEFSGFHGLNLLKDTFFCESKIVHLHNLHGEFLSPAIFKSLFKNKKVIWTLHDESLITGHCSCTLGCERWKMGCGQCPDLSIYPKVNFDNTSKVLKSKKKWIGDLQPIIVTPSHWLEKRVRIAYPELKHVQVIPNGIDTRIFQPLEKKAARARLKLPLTNKKIVLFVAEFATKNPFKGGEILRNLISDVDFKDFLFLTVGGQQETSYLNHISFPYISDEQDLVLLYASADVLLYPTQADNLPLVVLESMACGTPVIASNLGGIPEIITSKELGILVEEYKNPTAFKNAINSFFGLNSEEIEKMSTEVHKHIKKYFSLEMMTSNYLRLYNQN